MTNRDISVIAPVGLAMARVGRVLFQPFDFGKWFTIGFCAWLAYLGEGGGGGGGGGWNGFSNRHAGSMGDEVRQAADYFMSNLGWILPLVGGVLLIGFAVAIAIIWVSSRGKFMFLHCVAYNRAEVRVPWHQYRRQAQSLFWFRIIVAAATFILVIPAILGLVLLLVSIARGPGEARVIAVFLIIGLILLLIVFGVAIWLVRRFIEDFVVPMQFLRQNLFIDAWNEVWRIIRENPGQIALYILFRVLLSIAIGAIITTVALLTCCIACCCMAIPYIGTVILLPVLVFERAYSLYYLAQYDPDYRIIVEA